MSIKPTYQELEQRVKELEQAESERKQAENALNESEKKYRILFNQSSMAIYLHDLGGKIIDCNQVAAMQSGYSKDELLQLNVFDLHSKESRTINLPKADILKLWRQWQPGQRFSYEGEHRRKDGTNFPVEVSTGVILFNGDTFMLAICKDITERRQSELKVYESEAKFREVVSSIPGAVYQFLMHLDGTFEMPFLSEGAKQILNLPFEKLTDIPSIFQFLVPEDYENLITSIKKSAKTMQPWQHEFRIRTDSGHIKWLRGVSSPTRLPNDAIRWTGVLQDITKRIQAAEALQESEKLYRTLFEQNLNPIAVINFEGKYLDANQSFLDFVEKSKAELMTMNAFDFEPPDLKHQQRPKHLPVWQTGGTIETEYYINGRIKILELTITPISYRGKDALIGIGKDITDRKRLEAQLIEAQKMEAIGTLAGGIAHDFNNILSPMIGYTELLNFEIPAQSPQSAYVEGIYEAAMRARELVKQILLFSHNASQEVKPLKLQPLVGEALKLLKSSIPSTIGVTQRIDPECSPVVANPTQIHQIVMNLGTNAYHAMEENGGRLEVSLHQTELEDRNPDNLHVPAGPYACLSVSDTGEGVPKSVLDKIFDPYFTTKEKGKGTGLGLSVVHGIVQNNGGFIRVTSNAGKGTEFKVFLPIAGTSAMASDIQASPLIRCGTERLLLIDDEEAVLKMMHRMMERIGYHVTSYNSCLAALEAFKKDPMGFDLVITDMTMPVMTGDKLSQELHHIRPDIPIIICTGYSDKINREKAESLGIKGFLLKPVAMSEVSTMVRKILDGDA